jgi:hypothetical protein
VISRAARPHDPRPFQDHVRGRKPGKLTAKWNLLRESATSLTAKWNLFAILGSIINLIDLETPGRHRYRH